jgi:hypothetical protein
LIINQRKLKTYFMFSGGEVSRSHTYFAEECGGPY